METSRVGAAERLRGFFARGWARWVALGALLALLALGAVDIAAWRQARVANSGDAVAIAAVCYGGLLAQQTVTTPPKQYHGGPIVGALQQQMLNRVAQVFPRYYTGSLLTHEIDGYQAAIRDEGSATGARIMGGGMEDFAVTKLAIAGATATVTTTASLWLTVSQNDDHGQRVVATPHDAIVASFTLTRSHGAWLITAQTVQFASGNGP